MFLLAQIYAIKALSQDSMLTINLNRLTLLTLNLVVWLLIQIEKFTLAHFKHIRD